MSRSLFLIALQILAFWPVWRWYVRRMTDGSDEPWGVLALISLLIIVLHRTLRRETSGAGRIGWLSMVLTLLYALGFHSLPPLARATIAMSALMLSLSNVIFAQRFVPGLWILAMMSLPIMASLQFYMGYPLRVLVGWLCLPLLSLNGFMVTLQGTGLLWRGQLVQIDAPCSGIKMLWVAGFLVGFLACLNRMNTWRTIVVGLMALAAVLLGNVLRALALFHLEVSPSSYPTFLHDAVGLSVFAVVVFFIVRGATWQALPRPRFE